MTTFAFDHVGLSVADLDAQHRFYSQALGFAEETRTECNRRSPATMPSAATTRSCTAGAVPPGLVTFGRSSGRVDLVAGQCEGDTICLVAVVS